MQLVWRRMRRVLIVESVKFWFDLTNVLYWVQNQSQTFKMFVANQIGEIQRSTIPGEINPADLLTRGLSVSQLSQSTMWMEGPKILKEDKSTWPEKSPGNPANKGRINSHLQQQKITRQCFKIVSCPRSFQVYLAYYVSWLG